MTIEIEIKQRLGDEWLPTVYSDKIRIQRTRAYPVDIRENENRAEIQYTLLGIQLKVGMQRFACPDLATARYLRVFARVGCRNFAIPYDITRISTAADDLEAAWQRLLLLLDDRTRSRSKRSIAMIRSRLIRSIREELNVIGPGDAMPQFDRETKQRMS